MQLMPTAVVGVWGRAVEGVQKYLFTNDAVCVQQLCQPLLPVIQQW